MKIAIIAVVLILGGCNVQDRINARLPQICERMAEAHAAFIVVAATGTLPSGAVRKERVAWQAAQQACASQTIDIVTLAELYATIIRALRDTGSATSVQVADAISAEMVGNLAAVSEVIEAELQAAGGVKLAEQFRREVEGLK